MRARLVNEDLISSSHGSENMPAEDMAAEIASLVYTTYNGDDVDYESNEEDTEEVEQIIKDNVDISNLRYIDEDANIDEPLTEEGLDVFGDEEWILDQLSEEDIKKLYDAFKQTKFMSYSEPNDKFDLDQDIYDRNPDYDVD